MHMWVSQPSSRGPGSVLMGPGAGGLRITFSRQSSEVDFCLTQSGHWNPDSSWRALPTGRPAGVLTCFRHAGLLAVLQTRQACPPPPSGGALVLAVCAPPAPGFCLELSVGPLRHFHLSARGHLCREAFLTSSPPTPRCDPASLPSLSRSLHGPYGHCLLSDCGLSGAPGPST